MAKRLIVLDAGHGGADPGAVAGGMQEKTLVLKIAGQAMRLMEGQGMKVVMTRTADRFVSLRERVAIEHAAVRAWNGPTVFVSLHINASAGGARARGLSVFYHEVSTKGPILARTIFDAIQLRTQEMPQYNDGVLADEGDGILNDESFIDHALYVLKRTISPAALIELGFITNDADQKLLSDPKFQYAAALGMTEGLLGWFRREQG